MLLWRSFGGAFEGPLEGLCSLGLMKTDNERVRLTSTTHLVSRVMSTVGAVGVFGAALFLVGALGDLAPIIIAKALAGLPAGALGALVASFFDAILSGAARAKDE